MRYFISITQVKRNILTYRVGFLSEAIIGRLGSSLETDQTAVAVAAAVVVAVVAAAAAAAVGAVVRTAVRTVVGAAVGTAVG